MSTMRSTCCLFGTLLLAVMVVLMSTSSAATGSPDMPEVGSLGTANPFAQPSPLPNQMPPFDRIRDADYMPAFIAGMAAQRAEVNAIARNPQPATFDNTVVALEKSGQLLNRVSRTFFELDQSNSDDAILKIEPDITPKLSRHHDAIYLDPALFARIDALYSRRAHLQLDPESLQLLERYHTEFVRAGAALSDSAKEQLRGLNERLASLTTTFRQNVLKATRDGAVLIDNVGELDGLSAEQIGAAADAAKARGLSGKWLITLRSTTTQPVLEQLKDRAVRQRIFRASVSRAFGGPADNSSIIAQIVKLRADSARIARVSKSCGLRACGFGRRYAERRRLDAAADWQCRARTSARGGRRHPANDRSPSGAVSYRKLRRGSRGTGGSLGTGAQSDL